MTDSFWRDPPWRGGKGGYRMGLRPIESADWLPESISASERDRKCTLLKDPSSGVFAATDGSFAGQLEILEEVTHFADLALRRGDGNAIEPSASVGSSAEVNRKGHPDAARSSTAHAARHAIASSGSAGAADALLDFTPASVRSGSASGPTRSSVHDEIGGARDEFDRAARASDAVVDASQDSAARERDASSAPIVRASLLVPDDLCLLEERDGLYRLTAACVCAPSYWRLAEKIGRTLAGVHAPVPTLNEKLEASMRQFFARLPKNAVFERRNWLIHTDDKLYQPVSDAWRRIRPDEVATLIVRSERQTLKRLDPTTIVFTIRVTCHPLGEIVGHRDAARDLLDALAALDDAERAAKNYDYFAPTVIDYLSRIA